MEAFDFHAFDLARDDYPALFERVRECNGDLQRDLQAEVLSEITGHVLPDDFEVSIIPDDGASGDMIALAVLRDVGKGLIPISPGNIVLYVQDHDGIPPGALLRSHLTVGWGEARNLESAAAGVTDKTFDSRFTAGLLLDWFNRPLPLHTTEPHPAGKLAVRAAGLPWPSYVLDALTVALGWKDEICYRMAVEAKRLKANELPALQIVKRLGLTPTKSPDKQVRELCKRASPESGIALRRHRERIRVAAIAATWCVDGDVLASVTDELTKAGQQFVRADLKVDRWNDESRLLLLYAARWFSERQDPVPHNLWIALLRALRLANRNGLTDEVKQRLEGEHLRALRLANKTDLTDEVKQRPEGGGYTDLEGLEAAAKEVGKEWASNGVGLSDSFQPSRLFRPASVNATAKAYKGIEDDGVAPHHRTVRRWLTLDKQERVGAILAYRAWRILAREALAKPHTVTLAPMFNLVAAHWRTAAHNTAWARKVRGHGIFVQWHAGGERAARDRARRDHELYQRIVEAGIDPHDVVKAERKGIDPLEYIESHNAP